jgi:hypothetical protein
LAELLVKKIKGEIPLPYAAFISNNLTPEILTNLFLRNQLASNFLVARKPLPIHRDHNWTCSQMEHFHSRGFNPLKFGNNIGFSIWSDNIIGAYWGGVNIRDLSTHRLLNFINCGSNLIEKYERARETGVQMMGTPYTGFTIKLQTLCLDFTPELSFNPRRSQWPSQ